MEILEQREKKCISTLTKKRYDDICFQLNSMISDKNLVQNIENIIKNVMNFDPNNRSYVKTNSQKRVQKIKQEASEKGMTFCQYLAQKEKVRNKTK